MMWDHGVTIRCMVTWAAWLAGMAVGSIGVVIDDAKVVVIAAILSASGMMMVILNDNAKTRRMLWRMQSERNNAPFDRTRTLH